MTRASEILKALLERAPPRPPLERTTGLPYGWAIWLRALPPLPARPHARGEDVVGVFAERAVQPLPPGRELATWPAFFSLFQQGWSPAPRDERGVRWASRVGSGVLHVLFVVFLAWMAYLQSLMPPVRPEEGGGGERVQVGFVGAGDPGTPQASAGEAPAAGAPAQPARESAPAASTPAPVPAPSGEAAEPVPPTVAQVAVAEPVANVPVPPMPEVVVREVPEPQPPEPVAEQPVQVTEVAQPTIDYVLPPTTPREVSVRMPVQPQVREREVAVVQAPVIQAPQARPVDVPVRQPREVQLRAREVDEPLQDVEVRPMAVRGPRVEARLPGAPESVVRQREVATPSTSPSTSPAAATAAAPAPAASTPQGTGTAATQVPATGPDMSPSPGRTQGGVAPGGAAPAPSGSAGWQSPQAGDDWGQARSGEARPGGAPGLFDGEGRVRLPGEGTGQGPAAGAGQGQGLADRGAPGGDNDAWTRDRIDQSGTWLKRPPYDYEPTSFDRYWVPNESLLADWVRKGIKSVSIPIPGTGKKISCVVSMLQLGGGCGITDPDLNEQPSDGRPPPDVPFKPELQEDNGSVRPQG